MSDPQQLLGLILIMVACTIPVWASLYVLIEMCRLLRRIATALERKPDQNAPAK